jgi:hypothetical protein
MFSTAASNWSMRATSLAEFHVIVPTITATDSINPTATVGILTWRISVGSVIIQ